MLLRSPEALTVLERKPWLAVCKQTADKAGRLPVLRHAQGQHGGSSRARENEFWALFRNKRRGAK